MNIKSIEFIRKFFSVAVIFVCCATFAVGESLSTGEPRKVILIDCYISKIQVGVSEFYRVGEKWDGSYKNTSGKDPAPSALLVFMLESCVKFLEINKDIPSVEYIVDLLFI